MPRQGNFRFRRSKRPENDDGVDKLNGIRLGHPIASGVRRWRHFLKLKLHVWWVNGPDVFIELSHVQFVAL